MTCKDTIDKLQDYLDGDLKEKHSKEIETHLEHCFKCKREYRALTKLREVFRKERITLPSEEQWQKTWRNIEVNISVPKLSWYRGMMVSLDTFAMRLFGSRSITLRFAVSTGLFIVGTVLGAMYLTPSREISLRVFKEEHKIKEVPIFKEAAVEPSEPIHYLTHVNLDTSKPAVETVSNAERVQPLFLTVSESFEPAPVFTISLDSGASNESSELNNNNVNIDKQMQRIQNELAPSYNRASNSNPNRFVRFVNTTY